MSHKISIGRSLQVALGCSMALSLAGVAGSVADAQPAPPPAKEQAVGWSAGDPKLAWGPCPAFLPKGCGIAVLHGDPAKANVDIFLKVPGKSTLPLHTHTSAERMILVSGEMHVTYEGQKKMILKAGGYAYGPAKLPHEAYCASKAPCVLFIAFEAPLDAVPIEVKATNEKK